MKGLNTHALQNAAVSALASACAVWAERSLWDGTDALDPAVRWTLYSLAVDAVVMLITIAGISLFVRSTTCDVLLECRACGEQVHFTEEVINTRPKPLRCDACGNQARATDAPNHRALGCGELVASMGWGVLLGFAVRSHSADWLVGASLYVLVYRGVRKLIAVIGNPPRSKRALTPEGFELEVEEDQGFVQVLRCRKCTGESVYHAAWVTPKRPHAFLDCPHCGTPILKRYLPKEPRQ